MAATGALELLAGKGFMGIFASPPKEMSFIILFVPHFSLAEPHLEGEKEKSSAWGCWLALSREGPLAVALSTPQGLLSGKSSTVNQCWNCGRERGKTETSPLGFPSVRAPAEGAQHQSAFWSTFCRQWPEPCCPARQPGKLTLANHSCCLPLTSCHSLTPKNASPSRLGCWHLPAAELFSPVLWLPLPVSILSPSSWLRPKALPVTLHTDLPGPAAASLPALLVPIANEHSWGEITRFQCQRSSQAACTSFFCSFSFPTFLQRITERLEEGWALQQTGWQQHWEHTTPLPGTGTMSVLWLPCL